MNYKILFTTSIISIITGILNIITSISFGEIFISCEKILTNSAPCYIKYDIWFSVIFIGIGMFILSFTLGDLIYNKYKKTN